MTEFCFTANRDAASSGEPMYAGYGHPKQDGSMRMQGLQSLATPPDHARYSFLLEDQHPQSAREDLAEAVAMLVERPALEAALAAATARFDSDPEGAIAEQQRLRERKLALEERLRQLARQRVSAPAQEESSPAVVHPAQDEQGMD